MTTQTNGWGGVSAILRFGLIAILFAIHTSTTREPNIPDAAFKSGCRLLFNELNLFSREGHQFVELSIFCEYEQKTSNKVKLEKFKMVFFSHDGFLLAICNLEGTTTLTDDYYYVIGSKGTQNVNLDSSTCQSTVTSMTGDILLPHGPTHPIGIALIWHEKPRVLKNVELLKDGSVFRKTYITTAIESTIINNLQDFYVVGSSTTYVLCDYFTKFYAGYGALEEVLLRDWQGDTPAIDRSINRCFTNDADVYHLPMQVGQMRYSIPSPGRRNKCSQAFNRLETPPNKRPRLENQCATYMSTRQEQNTYSQNPNMFQSEIDAHSQSHEANVPPSGRTIVRPAPVDEATFTAKLQHMSPFQWQDCSKFPEEQLSALQKLPNDPYVSPTTLPLPYCSWLEYILPKKKIRCKWCNLLYNQEIIVDRPGSKLITEMIKDGIGRTNAQTRVEIISSRVYNKQNIFEHESSLMHKMSKEYVQLYDEGYRGDILKSKFEEKGTTYREYFSSTENLIVSVIQSLRMRISFRSYVIMAETLNFFDANIGHLYQTEQGMGYVSQAISEYMHSEYLKYLKTTQPELSVTLDTTTDVEERTVLAILFQTVDSNNLIKVTVYRITEIQGETGQQIFDKFISNLIEDDIDAYVKDHLVGLTTDGASSLESVFRNLLSSYVKTKLLYTHCSSHRLELVAAKSFEEFDMMKIVDEAVNDLFSFLGRQSAKRKNVFRKFTKIYGFANFEVKRVRSLRWVGHRYRALTPIIKRYKVIIATLESISLDKEFDLSSRDGAHYILQQLKDPNLLVSLCFAADVVKVIALISRELQTRGDTLIGHRSKRVTLTKDIESLLVTNEEHMTWLFDYSELYDPDNEHVGHNLTLSDFEKERVVFDGVLLNSPNAVFGDYALPDLMQNYVNSMKRHIKAYFPVKFDVFMPYNVVDNTTRDHKVRNIIMLNDLLEWGYSELQIRNDWAILVESIKNHPSIGEYETETPERFWNYFLNVDDDENAISWTDTTREIVRRALTIPASSTEPERVFSFYAYLKTLRRYSLSVRTVEHMIRVLFNGPKNIQEWNVLDVAKGIIQKISRPDDKSRRTTWHKKIVKKIDLTTTDNDNDNDDESTTEFDEDGSVFDENGEISDDVGVLGVGNEVELDY